MPNNTCALSQLPIGIKTGCHRAAMMGMNVITLSDVAFLADYDPIWGFCLDRI